MSCNGNMLEPPLGTGGYTSCMALPLSTSAYSKNFSSEHPYCLTVEMLNRVVSLQENSVKAWVTEMEESVLWTGSAQHAVCRLRCGIWCYTTQDSQHLMRHKVIYTVLPFCIFLALINSILNDVLQSLSAFITGVLMYLILVQNIGITQVLFR